MRQMNINIGDVHRERLRLEENVRKLRASLRHWQAQEIEYEEMKEGMQALGDNHAKIGLDALSSDSDNTLFGHSKSHLMTPKEKISLLRDENGNARTVSRITGLLSRRIDYVQKNITTVMSLLRTAEEEVLTAAKIIDQPAETHDEDGLPLTEVLEELDEEGNLISGSTSTPNQTAPEVVEALCHAGVQELVNTPNSEPAKEVPSQLERISNLNEGARSLAKESSEDAIPLPAQPSRPETFGPTADDTEEKRGKPRKSVSFAEGTKTEPAPSSTMAHNHITQNEVAPIPHGDHVEIIENEELTEPVIPVDESPEDAALRRQMIQYNMLEVGAIVAEMNLDDDEDHGSYSDHDSDGNSGASSVEEDEDNFGRASTRVLSDDYLAEMRALEKKLKAKAIVNVGPTAATSVPLVDNATEEQQATSLMPDAKKQKFAATKRVQFADDLDIQGAPKSSKPAQPPTLERNSAGLPPTKPESGPKKISRFKSAQSQGNTETTKNGEPSPNITPPRRPLASTIVERPYNSTAVSAPPELDEFDLVLLNQQISDEYHRTRNRLMQREGGFLARDDEQIETTVGKEEGSGKKISRFKAARLGGGSR